MTRGLRQRGGAAGGRLKLGLEFSYWWTGWVNRDTATAFRTELAVIYSF